MKIVTYLLAALLVAALAAAGFFYVTMFQPTYADYKRMKAGMPELDKAKAELKKYKEKEARETAWIGPAVNELSKSLEEEIKAGTAEVSAAGTGIVVNISEDMLYQPHSVTFRNESRALLQKVATMLASGNLKGKEITVGNTTEPVAGQGKGRKKISPREARALAADRSMALTRFLEQNKVDRDSLAAAAYSDKTPDSGFKIKDHKTVIFIANPPAPSTPPAAQPKPATPAPAAGVPQAQPKTIPIKPAQPKGQ
jgi:outer membrane protein OmpA-like peptidoglycan-associated protein